MWRIGLQLLISLLPSRIACNGHFTYVFWRIYPLNNPGLATILFFVPPGTGV